MILFVSILGGAIAGVFLFFFLLDRMVEKQRQEKVALILKISERLVLLRTVVEDLCAEYEILLQVRAKDHSLERELREVEELGDALDEAIVDITILAVEASKGPIDEKQAKWVGEDVDDIIERAREKFERARNIGIKVAVS